MSALALRLGSTTGCLPIRRLTALPLALPAALALAALVAGTLALAASAPAASTATGTAASALKISIGIAQLNARAVFQSKLAFRDDEFTWA